MKREAYYKFWQRMHAGAREKSFPLRVMFELTYNCNFKCKHCYMPPAYKEKYKNRELKTQEVFSILKQLKDMGCFYLGFTGGEPFLRPDIMDILDYAKQCGFTIIIYTNGSLITEKIADGLARLNPNKVDITIPALSEEAFERITGASGARDRVFGAIKFLRRKGVSLGFKSCVLRDNISEIDKMVGFVKSLGCSYRLDDLLSPRLDGSKIPYNCRVKERDKTPRQEKISFPLTAKELFKCGAGFAQAAITPAGELKICLMVDYPKYNIMDISFKKAWQKQIESMRNIALYKRYKCRQCQLIINDENCKN